MSHKRKCVFSMSIMSLVLFHAMSYSVLLFFEYGTESLKIVISTICEQALIIKSKRVFFPNCLQLTAFRHAEFVTFLQTTRGAVRQTPVRVGDVALVVAKASVRLLVRQRATEERLRKKELDVNESAKKVQF